jgi:hypothetical protein
MRPHPSGTSHHACTKSSHPYHAAGPVNLPTNNSHARVLTYTAHALILFNVYGIPLSSGIWIEYYFNTFLPPVSLLTLSSVFATQLTVLSLAVGVSAWLHARWPQYWRLYMFAGALLVCSAYIGLLSNNHSRDIWVLVLCQGVLTGAGLGVLGAVSMRVLSAHYKYNITAISTLCVSAGFLGAIAYTALTWMTLRLDNPRLTYGLTLILLSLTLLPTLLLTKPSTNTQPLHRRAPLPRKRWRALLILAALPLTLTLATILPFYTPLLAALQPGPHRADTGPYIVLTLFFTALITSALVPHLLDRFLAQTLFGAACTLAGVAAVPLVWMRRLEVAGPCAALYGVGMGVLCTLWLKVVVECLEEGGMRDSRGVGVLAAMFGVWAAGEVVCGAAVLQGVGRGVEIGLGAVAACLALSGLIIWAEGGVRNWRRT